jgi:hypothetical protein
MPGAWHANMYMDSSLTLALTRSCFMFHSHIHNQVLYRMSASAQGHGMNMNEQEAGIGFTLFGIAGFIFQVSLTFYSIEDVQLR